MDILYLQLLFYFLGFSSSWFAFYMVLRKYKEDKVELNKKISELDEEIHTLRVKYGLDEIAWNYNGWEEEMIRVPDKN